MRLRRGYGIIVLTHKKENGGIMKLNLRGLSAEIKASADEILKTLGICEGADGATVEAKRGDNLKVAFDGENTR